MKRVFLIHGWEGYPEEGWRPWLRDRLKAKGFEVIVPAMPNTKNPTAELWIPYLTKLVGKPSKDDYFIGHSLGCITILHFLESLKEGEKVGGAVLIAGFSHNLEYEGYNGELSSFFNPPLDFEKVKKHCNKFVAIMSDDDPWVPLKHGETLREELGAKLIIEHAMKHFSGDDGVNELPVAEKELLSIAQ